MPEGDTVHRTARMLHGALAGLELTGSDFRVPRYATVDLQGQTVTEVLARGKHLLLRTSGSVTVHSHLGMDGSWRILGPSQRLPGPHHEIRVILSAGDTRAAGLSLKILEVIRTIDEQLVVGHLGPDVLGPDWNLSQAVANVREKAHISISEALLDQSLVAGFGNVYRNELCFLRGYHPDRLVRDCDIEATLALGKRVMELNRESARHVTTGDNRPGRSHYVYGRRGRPCLRCGAPIRKRTVSSEERVTYWCPECQAESVNQRGRQ